MPRTTGGVKSSERLACQVMTQLSVANACLAMIGPFFSAIRSSILAISERRSASSGRDPIAGKIRRSSVAARWPIVRSFRASRELT